MATGISGVGGGADPQVSELGEADAPAGAGPAPASAEPAAPAGSAPPQDTVEEYASAPQGHFDASWDAPARSAHGEGEAEGPKFIKSDALLSDEHSHRSVAREDAHTHRKSDYGRKVVDEDRHTSGKFKSSTRTATSFKAGECDKTTVSTNSDGKRVHSTRTDESVRDGKVSKHTRQRELAPHQTRQHVTAEKSLALELVNKEKSGSVGGAVLAHAEHTFQSSNPLLNGVKTEAKITGPEASYAAHATGKVDPLNHEIEADVGIKLKADLFDAHGQATQEATFKVEGQVFKVQVKLDADAKVGIDGELHLKVKVGPQGASVELGGSAFAGAKADVGMGITLSAAGLGPEGKDLKLFEGEGQYTVAAGAAAAASFETKVEGGELAFKTHAQLTVGIGGGFSMEGKVDPLALGKAGETVLENAAANGDLLRYSERAAATVFEAGILGPTALLSLDEKLAAKELELGKSAFDKLRSKL